MITWTEILKKIDRDDRWAGSVREYVVDVLERVIVFDSLKRINLPLVEEMKDACIHAETVSRSETPPAVREARNKASQLIRTLRRQHFYYSNVNSIRTFSSRVWTPSFSWLKRAIRPPNDNNTSFSSFCNTVPLNTTSH